MAISSVKQIEDTLVQAGASSAEAKKTAAALDKLDHPNTPDTEDGQIAPDSWSPAQQEKARKLIANLGVAPEKMSALFRSDLNPTQTGARAPEVSFVETKEAGVGTEGVVLSAAYFLLRGIIKFAGEENPVVKTLRHIAIKNKSIWSVFVHFKERVSLSALLINEKEKIQYINRAYDVAHFEKEAEPIINKYIREGKNGFKLIQPEDMARFEREAEQDLRALAKIIRDSKRKNPTPKPFSMATIPATPRSLFPWFVGGAVVGYVVGAIVLTQTDWGRKFMERFK